MACKFCNGEGCEHCMGNMANNNNQKNPTANLAGVWAKAKASAQTRGEERDRPPRYSSASERSSRSGHVWGLIDGPNIKATWSEHQGRNGNPERRAGRPTNDERFQTAGENTPSSISRCFATENIGRKSDNCLVLAKILVAPEHPACASGQSIGDWRRLGNFG